MKSIAMICLSVWFLYALPAWAGDRVLGTKALKPAGFEYVSGELLVKYRPSVRTEVAEYYHSTLGISTLQAFDFIGVQHIKLPEDMNVQEALAMYARDPDVEYAEPNYIVHAEATTPWTTGGTGGPFDLTTSRYTSASYSLTHSSSGNYANNEDHYAQIHASSDFSSYMGTKLEYYFNGISEKYYDYLHVDTSSDGSSWSDHYQLSGSTGGSWYDSYPADTKAHEGNSDLYVRYRFTSDFSITYDGWYIDDVAVTAWSSNTADSGYQFMNGTSMATPHVAGLAALVQAYRLNWTNLQIKAAIVRSVDPVGSLRGKVSAGGRINAYNGLVYEPDPLPGINSLLLGDED